MVEIYSPSGEEEKLAFLLEKEMRKLGFDVTRDPVGNVIGEYQRGQPKILLCGHMDTVPSLLPVKIEDNILYGRGTVDAKGPLAAMIISSSQLLEENFQGSIKLIGVVDEEGKGKGIRHIVEEGIDADYAIFGEPTNVDSITVGYRGSILLKFIFETQTGHSSAPWLFENSVEKAFDFWRFLNNRITFDGKDETHFNTLSACLERIKGGVPGSIVPPYCEMELGVRLPPSVKAGEFLEDICQLIEEFKLNNSRVKLQLEILDATDAYLSDTRNPLLRALTRAIWEIKGINPKLIKKTGTGDMNIFGNRVNIPAITYGPGDPHLDHTPQEHINLPDYLESIKILKKGLENLLQLI
jgi:LysW-gamma-L-lysine carboxypeptidase